MKASGWYPSKPHRKLCKPGKARKALYMRLNPTPSEALLWEVLREKRLGVRFRRQAVLYGYIADFFAPSIGLAVEVDGSSHDDRGAYDEARDAGLARYGIKTLRLTADDVMACRARALVRVAIDGLLVQR